MAIEPVFLKLAWLRDPTVPQGQRALGTFECLCGAVITDVTYGSGEYTCPCGITVDGHGWVKNAGVS